MSVKQHIRYRVEARGLDIMGLLIDNLMYTEYLPTFIDRPHMHDTWHLFYFVTGNRRQNLPLACRTVISA
jgi:hypothetical protein